MYDMAAVKDKKLVALLLEEALPAGCVVEGVDFSAHEDEPITSSDTLPTFLQRYEDMAYGEHREISAAVERDRQLIEHASNSSSTYTKQGVSDKFYEKKVST